MAAAVGTDSEGSVNVELNVVPFIDLMSCLTAFLLVTAVWTNLAQIKIKPKGQGQPSQSDPDPQEWVKASVLITETDINVGLSRVQELVRIPKEGEEHNWTLLRETMDKFKTSTFLAAPNPFANAIEIGAEDKVKYETIVTTMDTALAVGFRDVGLAAPNELTAKFNR
jgi:biopolymer transport protein ExbD